MANFILGVDECGMGSWAGKVVICAVRAPFNWEMQGLKDSKKLTRPQREALKNQLMELVNSNQLQFSIHISTNTDIDQYGLGVCHKTCVAEVINDLYLEGDEVIMDGYFKPNAFQKYGLNKNCEIKTEAKADGKFPVVMAASILAKQYHDAKMLELHEKHPEYNWKSNVGYISAEHKDAVRKFGLTEYHRKSYKVKL